MIAADITINNLPAIDAALQELGGKMARKIGGRALKAGCQVIEAEAKALAPVHTGKLQASIKVKAGRVRKDFKQYRVTTNENLFQGETFYAAFLIYGHYVGSRKLGDKRTHVPGDNFLRIAFDEKQAEAERITMEMLVEELQEAWG